MDNITILAIVVAIVMIGSTALFLIYGSPEERRMQERLKRFTDPKSLAIVAKGGSPNLAANKGATVSVSFDQKIRQLIPNADQMRLRVERAGLSFKFTVQA